MHSYGPPHMAGQRHDDQLEHTYSSSVRIRDVALKTCQRRWTCPVLVLWKIWSNSSLSLLLCPLCSGVVLHVSVSSMGKLEHFNYLLFLKLSKWENKWLILNWIFTVRRQLLKPFNRVETLYRSSPLAGLQGYIPYPHTAAVCMFELVVPL